ncbi:uncharacterized protein KY384_003425 [Bacidia gigantensis]|uniref:uncharacterized protein n=1 Tax=Bacidia gigantensis TaxID=2732470 RepID=UPI001D04F59C|nr:uncharacterized protein KY384_003425 [Bacidia gigantensis]KAG8531789.1 hypothetical protein KY384_003425 [Bacidia gigantensis]
MAPFSQLHLISFSLFTIIATVQAVIPTCSGLYGQPTRENCIWLVGGLAVGWPNTDIADSDFFYALRDTPKPDELTEAEYRNWFEVPKLVSHGSREKLILTLFAPNSQMDKVSKQILTLNANICALQASQLGLDVGGYQDCTAPPADDAFYDFLEQNLLGGVTEYSVNPPGTPASTPSPKCGEPCYGEINLCSTTDWCKCQADAFQGVGSARFQGTCKSSYFSYSSGLHGKRELSMGPPNSSVVDVRVHSGEPPLSEHDIAKRMALPVAAEASLELAVCPCNCTYVSIECCKSENKGIVYEAKEKNLGGLEPPAGQCCDQATGAFKTGARNGTGPSCV